MSVLDSLLEGFSSAAHPRDFRGRFTVGGVAKELKAAGRVTLPDGSSANRVAGGFTVTRRGSKPSFHSDADGAARQILSASARSSHPDSVGGATRYANIEEFHRQQSNAKARKARAVSYSYGTDKGRITRLMGP